MGNLSTSYFRVPDVPKHTFDSSRTGRGILLCNGEIRASRPCIPAFYPLRALPIASVDDVLVAWNDLEPLAQGPFITVKAFTGIALFNKNDVVLFGFEPIACLLLRQRLDEFYLRSKIDEMRQVDRSDIFSS